MPLSRNEIKARAARFADKWKDAHYEKGETHSFYNEFFEVFGKRRRDVAVYEQKVKKLDNRQGFIDLFWPGKLLIEQKSAGRDLSQAREQATDYFLSLKEHEKPRYILLSDFQNFEFIDLEGELKESRFALNDFPEYVRLFDFIAGYQTIEYKDQDPVNIRASELMSVLHGHLEAGKYRGTDLERLLVRVMFCLFADDTGIFEPDIFLYYIENHTKEDGSDLGAQLIHLFQILDTPEKEREDHLDDDLKAFPYVNGRLFSDTIRIPSFNAPMRKALLECCYFNWSKVSPALFGSLFQTVMLPEEQRQGGAHYTSERNILKTIHPLFLDELFAEFQRIKDLKRGKDAELQKFHQKLGQLTFFDPACGCGNFLILAYRELRELEIKVLEEMYPGDRTGVLDVSTLSLVDVDQFHGIEIEEFAVRIAETALWLTDHQMNQKLSASFGQAFARLPLKKSAHIVHANALTTDWKSVLPPEKCSFMLGNPPFVGSKMMNKQQREELLSVFPDVKGAGVLDYVTAWFGKAAQYIQKSDTPLQTPIPLPLSPKGERGEAPSPYEKTPIPLPLSPEGERGEAPSPHGEGVGGEVKTRVAFVSTNSITQGEQVGILWAELMNKYHIKIHFAHKSFKWTIDEKKASGMKIAAVSVIIVGFGINEAEKKLLFEYQTPISQPILTLATNINPYLVNGENVVILSRQSSLCPAPLIGIGNKPIDGGNYLFLEEEMKEFIKNEPDSEKYFRKWMGADEFIHGKKRYCLWLGDCSPEVLRKMPFAMKRIEAVKQSRLASSSIPTQKLALTPTRFHVENIPKGNFMVIPKVSTSNREYIPMGFLDQEYLASDLLFVVRDATLYHFGILTSKMHMAWVRYVCGRLGDGYRYSKDIVYNNFPWPPDVTEAYQQRVALKAQAVLNARAEFPDSSLADLYDPLTMPPALRKAHNDLDKEVDKLYRKDPFKDDAERVAYLFFLYQKMTAGLMAGLVEEKKKKGRKK